MAIEFENVVSDYSDPKKKVLYYLKVMQKARLQELAKAMKISKMAVHKHLTRLQKRGLVESVEIREGVGRPKMEYRLTSKSKTIFPSSYGALAVCALDFIEKNMGKEGVEKVLRERQVELFNKYNKRLKTLNFDEKVKELAKIRDEEGYIAESKKNRRQNIKIKPEPTHKVQSFAHRLQFALTVIVLLHLQNGHSILPHQLYKMIVNIPVANNHHQQLLY